QFARKRWVVGGENIDHGRINRQIPPGGTDLVEQLGEEPRAGAVDRVAARRAKGAGMVAGDLVNQVNAAMKGIRCGLEIVPIENRARMIERMDFQGQSFLEPGLKLRVFRMD